MSSNFDVVDYLTQGLGHATKVGLDGAQDKKNLLINCQY